MSRESILQKDSPEKGKKPEDSKDSHAKQQS
eukprot:CAMPEP_0170502140 /NCGR_PEP_ID=MMETSP0208-20121228/40564_1 /TAXON_ID=197538 /ORGANISM="Strombidium inclinatum, Strain S3" /LENGTH=30 /DNA_ID= /DNA_START= /DNA_END= /DNA_ORIENTATION=